MVLSITGIGTVVSGLLTSGKINLGDNLMIGPDKNGIYKNTQIKSIHCKRVNV